jgi:hypothetical protein
MFIPWPCPTHTRVHTMSISIPYPFPHPCHTHIISMALSCPLPFPFTYPHHIHIQVLSIYICLIYPYTYPYNTHIHIVSYTYHSTYGVSVRFEVGVKGSGWSLRVRVKCKGQRARVHHAQFIACSYFDSLFINFDACMFVHCFLYSGSLDNCRERGLRRGVMNFRPQRSVGGGPWNPRDNIWKYINKYKKHIQIRENTWHTLKIHANTWLAWIHMPFGCLDLYCGCLDLYVLCVD